MKESLPKRESEMIPAVWPGSRKAAPMQADPARKLEKTSRVFLPMWSMTKKVN